MNFTPEQKKEAFEKSPREVRRFIMSDELAEKFDEIGKSNNLLIDKVGVLGDEVILEILGLTSAADFSNRIKQAGIVADSRVDSIVEEVNTKVFLPFRNLLVNKNTENISESMPKKDSAPEPSRDSILAEIENPTPTIHPISAVDQTVAGPARILRQNSSK